MRTFIVLILLLASLRCGVAAPLELHDKLIITDLPDSQTVYSMRSDGSDKRKIWQVPKGCGAFGAFSVSGKKALSYDRHNLYLHDLPSGRFRRLLLWDGMIGASIQDPSFSLDEKWVLCAATSRPDPSESSVLLNLSASQSYSTDKNWESIKGVMLKPKFDRSYYYVGQPQWRADGKRIIAAVGSLDLTASSLRGDELELWSMNPDGSMPVRITRNALWDESPSWDYEAKQIAWVRHFNDYGTDYVSRDASELFVMNADGKNERRLTHNVAAAEKVEGGYFNRMSRPLFSPNGQRIAFTQDGEIFTVGVDGGSLVEIGAGYLKQWPR